MVSNKEFIKFWYSSVLTIQVSFVQLSVIRKPSPIVLGMRGYTRKTIPIIKLGTHQLKNKFSGVELDPKNLMDLDQIQ